MDEEKKSGEHRVPIQWIQSVGMDAPYVDNMLVTFSGEMVLIGFFQLEPAIVPVGEEKSVKQVDALCRARVFVTRSTARTFAETILQHLDKVDAKLG